jgi:hypothetical protein
MLVIPLGIFAEAGRLKDRPIIGARSQDGGDAEDDQ